MIRNIHTITMLIVKLTRLRYVFRTFLIVRLKHILKGNVFVYAQPFIPRITKFNPTMID